MRLCNIFWCVQQVTDLITYSATVSNAHSLKYLRLCHDGSKTMSRFTRNINDFTDNDNSFHICGITSHNYLTRYETGCTPERRRCRRPHRLHIKQLYIYVHTSPSTMIVLATMYYYYYVPRYFPPFDLHGLRTRLKATLKVRLAP